MVKIRTYIKLSYLWLMTMSSIYAVAYAQDSTPAPARLLLEAPRSSARLTQSWPIRFTVHTQQPEFATCRPADWASRVVWQVVRVGKGPVALSALVVSQTATAGPMPLTLTPQRPLTVTINLRQYSPASGQPWQPGLYRVSAKLALCAPVKAGAPSDEAQPLWLKSQYPVYLDILP